MSHMKRLWRLPSQATYHLPSRFHESIQNGQAIIESLNHWITSADSKDGICVPWTLHFKLLGSVQEQGQVFQWRHESSELNSVWPSWMWSRWCLRSSRKTTIRDSFNVVHISRSSTCQSAGGTCRKVLRLARATRDNDWNTYCYRFHFASGSIVTMVLAKSERKVMASSAGRGKANAQFGHPSVQPSCTICPWVSSNLAIWIRWRSRSVQWCLAWIQVETPRWLVLRRMFWWPGNKLNLFRHGSEDCSYSPDQLLLLCHVPMLFMMIQECLQSQWFELMFLIFDGENLISRCRSKPSKQSQQSQRNFQYDIIGFISIPYNNLVSYII